MRETSAMENRPGIRTYKLRKSRVTAGQAAAIAQHGERFLFTPVKVFSDRAWLASHAAVIVEIGFGMGEATAALAASQPELAVVAADLHTPGVGNLLGLLGSAGLDNVRVVESDGLLLVRDQVAPQSLAGIRCFFSDPWPKARHHKRRLLARPNFEVFARAVKSGGFLHFATDWPEYAEFALEQADGAAEWELVVDGDYPRWANPADRPKTKFEQRGIEAGRPITDLVWRRL